VTPAYQASPPHHLASRLHAARPTHRQKRGTQRHGASEGNKSKLLCCGRLYLVVCTLWAPRLRQWQFASHRRTADAASPQLRCKAVSQPGEMKVAPAPATSLLLDLRPPLLLSVGTQTRHQAGQRIVSAMRHVIIGPVGIHTGVVASGIRANASTALAATSPARLRVSNCSTAVMSLEPRRRAVEAMHDYELGRRRATKR